MHARILFAAGLFLVCASSSAADCRIKWRTTTDIVEKVMKLRGGPVNKNYGPLCAKLDEFGVGLVVQGEATVLAGTSVAWAIVGLEHLQSGGTSFNMHGTYTYVNASYASQDVAENDLYLAVNEATEIVYEDIDRAIMRLMMHVGLVQLRAKPLK